MCRFKTLTCASYLALIAVSIHPMCRFKKVLLFQQKQLISFNTSYVSVQALNPIKKELAPGCFNTSYVSVQDRELPYFVPIEPFQYILCVGSRDIDLTGAYRLG